MLEISWKLHDGNFLETIRWKFFRTICWEIWLDAGGFLKRVIMAQCYGIILQFKAMVPGAQLSIPAAQTFLE